MQTQGRYQNKEAYAASYIKDKFYVHVWRDYEDTDNRSYDLQHP